MGMTGSDSLYAESRKTHQLLSAALAMNKNPRFLSVTNPIQFRYTVTTDYFAYENGKCRERQKLST